MSITDSKVMRSRHVVFRGRRTKEGARVWIEDQETGDTVDLPHIRRHSPSGMEWGYGGSGPADLALSILAWHLEVDAVAPGLYQHFKAAFVEPIQEDEWSLPAFKVSSWLEQRWSRMTEDQVREDLRA